MSSTAEIRRAGQNNRREFAVKIGDFEHTIIFKSGGAYTPPEKLTAAAGNGFGEAGLYDAVEITGKATISSTLYKALFDLSRQSRWDYATTGTHYTYLNFSDDMKKGLTIKASFANVRVNWPIEEFEEMGADTAEVTLSFSVNDRTFYGQV